MIVATVAHATKSMTIVCCALRGKTKMLALWMIGCAAASWCEQSIELVQFNVSCVLHGVLDQYGTPFAFEPAVVLDHNDLNRFLVRSETAIGSALPALTSMHTIHNGTEETGYEMDMRLRFYRPVPDEAFAEALLWSCPPGRKHVAKARGSCHTPSKNSVGLSSSASKRRCAARSSPGACTGCGALIVSEQSTCSV